MDTLATYSQKYAPLLPAVDERARRLGVASDVQGLGYGGIALAQRASGLERQTIAKGRRELAEGVLLPANRVRQRGGGRKQLTATDHTVLSALLALVAESSRGEPEAPLPWTPKSTRTLASALTRKRHGRSHVTVASWLVAEGYSLEANQKAREGTSPPARDAQVHYLSVRAKEYLGAGEPVIAVDPKKKALGATSSIRASGGFPRASPAKSTCRIFPLLRGAQPCPTALTRAGRSAGT